MRGMIKVRKATFDDIPAYLELQRESWGDSMAVQEQKAKERFDRCLDGILMAEVEGKVVGTTTMIRLTDYDFDRPLTWNEATGDGWCSTHDPDGSICFGVDLSVAKDHPNEIVDALMAGCMQLVIEAGVKYCILGGRMPWYHRFAHKYTPEEYLWKRSRSRYLDPQVNMYSKVPGLRIMKLIPEYFDDPESLNYGVLLRWRNPFYRFPGHSVWSKLPMIGYNQWQKLDRMVQRRRLRRSQ